MIAGLGARGHCSAKADWNWTVRVATSYSHACNRSTKVHVGTPAGYETKPLPCPSVGRISQPFSFLDSQSTNNMRQCSTTVPPFELYCVGSIVTQHNHPCARSQARDSEPGVCAPQRTATMPNWMQSCEDSTSNRRT